MGLRTTGDFTAMRWATATKRLSGLVAIGLNNFPPVPVKLPVMRRMTKQIACVTLLTGIAGVLAVTALPGRSLRPTMSAPQLTEAESPNTTPPVVWLTEAKPEPSRVSVSFTDEASESYALLRGGTPGQTSPHRTDLDLWFGQYSDRDYRPLPASPIEKEPSRLNVKLSIAF